MNKHAWSAVAVGVALVAGCGAARAADGNAAGAARGLWMTPEKDAVIAFAPCAGKPSALCGTIVWDKDAGTPKDTCGTHIAELDRYAHGAWRDGWAYDPRDRKYYHALLRVQGATLALRAYIGVEILGQTQILYHVAALPASPVCGHK